MPFPSHQKRSFGAKWTAKLKIPSRMAVRYRFDRRLWPPLVFFLLLLEYQDVRGTEMRYGSNW